MHISLSFCVDGRGDLLCTCTRPSRQKWDAYQTHTYLALCVTEYSFFKLIDMHKKQRLIFLPSNTFIVRIHRLSYNILQRSVVLVGFLHRKSVY